MAAKAIFTAAQKRILHNAVKRMYKQNFKTQEDMARAFKLTQQSVQAMLAGRYTPSERYAKEIALLLGTTLEDLVGPYGPEIVAKETGAPMHDPKALPNPAPFFENLDICVRFHRQTKTWKPWTLAAAQAGYFGPTDFAPAEWAEKLDRLERLLASDASSA